MKILNLILLILISPLIALHFTFFYLQNSFIQGTLNYKKWDEDRICKVF
jgi:hypothetical protein